MKRLLLTVVLGWGITGLALDGFYLGGRIGQVELSGSDGSIGYGLDIGARANSYIDGIIQISSSSHGNNLTLTSIVPSAEIQLGRVNDFGFTLGLGPGFYFFKQTGISTSEFGLHGSVGGDLWMEDTLRIGVEWRYHSIFSSSNLWHAMMRVGYLFEM